MLAAVSLRLAIFASGAGTTAQAVIDACAGGRIDGEVVLVLSNNADAPALERARAAAIPTRHLSRRTDPDADALDAAQVEAVRTAGATHVLLAGYMRKLGPAMLAAYEGRIYNTHPALLPAHGGEGMYGDRVHAAVLADGHGLTGATVHVVSADYDAGAIVRAVEVPVLARRRRRLARRAGAVGRARARRGRARRDRPRLSGGGALTMRVASPVRGVGTPTAARSRPGSGSCG